MTKSLSIIIPAYNEENRIEKTLRDYLKIFADNAEIIVIPNGCHDHTVQVIEKVQKDYPDLIYKNFPESILKGGAILEGFKIAQGRHIGYVDADGATNATEYKRLANMMTENDGIIASRRVPGSTIVTPAPFIRRLASIVFNLIVRLLFLFPYHDTQCGAKIFTRAVIEKISGKIVTKDWAFDIDLLYQARKHRFTVKEMATVWADKEDSKLNVKKVAPQMLLSVIKLRLLHSPLQSLMRRSS